MDQTKVFENIARSFGSSFTLEEITQKLHESSEWNQKDYYIKSCIKSRKDTGKIRENNDGSYEWINSIESSHDCNDPASILGRWHYNGTDTLEQRINSYKDNPENDRLLDIVNQIVLWKISRQVFFDSDPELLNDVVSLPDLDITGSNVMTAEWKRDITSILERLMRINGVGLPMASTILHFFHPSTFLIIDQRAYRTVYQQPIPTIQTARMYIEYLEKCVEYYNENNLSRFFPFSKLDRYTYQLDIKNGNRVDY